MPAERAEMPTIAIGRTGAVGERPGFIVHGGHNAGRQMDDQGARIRQLQLRAYGCPCQFNALPTHGNCEAVAGMQIDQGYHGDTPLDEPRQ
jgi:hypothetical protein